MTGTATTIANALRPIAPNKKLAAADVPLIDELAAQWDARERAVHAMHDPGAFFAGVRKVTGPLGQVQVDTITGLLASAAHWPLSWLAYGLATTWHEAKFAPVEEIGKGRGKRYATPGARSDGAIGPVHGGQAPYGRGFAQITWVDNYEWLDKVAADAGLIRKGDILKDFDLALRPDIAALALIKGMEGGAFTGKKLADYLPGPRGTQPQFEQARRIINGTDKKTLIAGYALGFQDAGSAGGWS
jgi:hypothetical protein